MPDPHIEPGVGRGQERHRLVTEPTPVGAIADRCGLAPNLLSNVIALLRAGGVAEVAVDDNDLRTEISLRDPALTEVLGVRAVPASPERSIDGFPAFGVLVHSGAPIGKAVAMEPGQDQPVGCRWPPSTRRAPRSLA